MSWEARCGELEAVVAGQQRVMAELEAVLVELREQQAAVIEAQAARIAELVSRVAELEARLTKDSQNSSQPPSRDGRDRRERRAEERAARKAARADAGEQPSCMINPRSRFPTLPKSSNPFGEHGAHARDGWLSTRRCDQLGMVWRCVWRKPRPKQPPGPDDRRHHPVMLAVSADATWER